jgi:hypothetical protein
MRGKNQPGAKPVQSRKPVAAATAHHPGAGRKKGSAKRKSLSRALAPWAGHGQLAALNPQQLITRAIAKGDISTVEKLLQMQRELKAEAAKEAYFQALAAFQAECPIIRKKRKVFEKNSATDVRYRFAPIEDIAEIAGPLLTKRGFSWTIKAQQEPASLKAIVESHNFGHTEITEFAVPIMPDAYMTAPQKVASALTFACRYAFRSAFGIITGSDDDDAQSAGVESANGAKAAERRVGPEAPGTLPENPGVKEVEKLLKQMTWLPETTAAMYRKQAQQYVQKKDENSLRGLQQSLNKQIATKGAKK